MHRRENSAVLDVDANDLVDKLAKRAAAEHSVDPETIEKIILLSDRVTAVATRLAQCTVLANEHKIYEVSSSQRRGTTIHDSEGVRRKPCIRPTGTRGEKREVSPEVFFFFTCPCAVGCS